MSYGEDNIYEPYMPGSLLFSLELSNTQELRTYWHDLTPNLTGTDSDKHMYFRKKLFPHARPLLSIVESESEASLVGLLEAPEGRIDDNSWEGVAECLERHFALHQILALNDTVRFRALTEDDFDMKWEEEKRELRPFWRAAGDFDGNGIKDAAFFAATDSGTAHILALHIRPDGQTLLYEVLDLERKFSRDKGFYDDSYSFNFGIMITRNENNTRDDIAFGENFAGSWGVLSYEKGTYAYAFDSVSEEEYLDHDIEEDLNDTFSVSTDDISPVGIAVVTGEGVRIRASGSRNSEILGSTNKGDQVEILRFPTPGSEWAQIRLNGLIGWMHSDYLATVR